VLPSNSTGAPLFLDGMQKKYFFGKERNISVTLLSTKIGLSWEQLIGGVYKKNSPSKLTGASIKIFYL
jgi:hypothetical protein